MSEDQETKKPAAPAEPPAPQSTGQHTSKSYDELLKGFAEIKRIQVNQETFEKHKKADDGAEKEPPPADKK